MPKGRASPGVGRGIGDNSGLPAHDKIKAALALDILFDEKLKELKEQQKRARSGFGRDGISIEDLSRLKKMKDDAPSEIEAFFRRAWHYMGALFEPLHEQYDILKPKPVEGPKRAVAFTMGLMAGLYGKPLDIPPALVGDERNQLIEGHNEGRSRRDQADKDILLFAVDPKNAGKVVDGTGKAAGDKAAKDFAADQKAEGKPDPLKVDGVVYPTMRQANAARARLAKGTDAGVPGADAGAPQTQPDPDAPPPGGEDMDEAIRIQQELQGGGEPEGSGDEPAAAEAAPPITEPEPPPAPPAPPKPARVPMPAFDKLDDDLDNWFASDKAAFRRWFESLPEDYVPPITHVGAVKYFRELREAQAAEKAAAAPAQQSADDFEAPQEELDKQLLRPKQEAELPDEDEIARGVEAAKKSGFVDGPTAARAEAAKRRSRAGLKKPS